MAKFTSNDIVTLFNQLSPHLERVPSKGLDKPLA